MRNLNFLLLFILTGNLAFAQTPPVHTNLLYSDNLLDDGSSGVGTIVNNSGQFVTNGWKATSSSSQLFITLPANLPKEGTMTVNVTNFDPYNQSFEARHQIINLYSRAAGDQSVYNTTASWVNIRTGTSYSDGVDQAGYKMLAAYNSRRREERFIQDATWYSSQTYEFKLVWDEEYVWTYAQGELQGHLVMNADFIERFRYVFLGKDNMYVGMPGPIYSNLRIYTTGTGTPNPLINFTDITFDAGVEGVTYLEHIVDPPDDTKTFGHGVSFGDFNLDGLYDLIYTNAGAQSMDDIMYRNAGNNIFNNITSTSGANDNGHTHGVVSADFDNDGDLDLFFSNQPISLGDSGGRNRMYRNDGNGNYTEITGSAGISTENSYSRAAVALDMNNDGWQDLFVMNWGSINDTYCTINEVYQNDGDGTFTRVHNGADGPTNDPVAYGRQGGTAVDVDNDGDQDIYVCRRGNVNWLFINDGNGNYTEQAGTRGVACTVGVRHHGATFVDIDNDGDLDLFVMPYGIPGEAVPQVRFFKNNGNGYFTDHSNTLNVYASGYSILFTDIDNDADFDIYMLNNPERDPGAAPKLYVNDGNGNLTYSYVPGLELYVGDVRGGAFGDIDKDGDQDVYMASSRNDNNYLLRNDSNTQNHYIDVLCVGPGGDYGGFGSKVAVYESGHLGDVNYLLGYQQSMSNYAYLCQNQTALHFGLASHTTCDIRVTLTDGSVFDYTNVAADQEFSMSGAGLAATTVTQAVVYNQTGLTLTWDDVALASGYNVYRGTSPNFSPDLAGGSNRVASNVTDQNGGAAGVQWTDTDQVVGDAENNYYYIITPLRGAGEGEASAVFGEFDFELITTATTDFNEVAIPLQMDGLSTAQDLMNSIPYCNSVAKWDPATQGYDQYIPGLEFTNFSILAGHPYYVNVTQNSLFTVTGPMTNPAFVLITTETTDFNEVMVPLDKTNLTSALDLMNDIAYCNSVAQWNPASQGYDQYIPGLSFTNFETYPGYPYYVNVTQGSIWPGGGGMAKTNSVESPTIKGTVPHMIWGELPQGAHKSVQVRATINGQTLSGRSPGSGIANDSWYLQLADINAGWQAGDKINIEFYQDAEKIAESSVILSWDPADRAEQPLRTAQIPQHFELRPNFPNPFNPETSIQYVLPASGNAELVITDINGKTVKTLVHGVQQPGLHTLTWNGTNEQNLQVASGVYFYTLKYQSKSVRRKLLLVR